MDSSKKESETEDLNQYIIIFNKKKHIIKFEIDDKRILFTIVKIEKNAHTYFLHQSKLESLRQNSKILQLYQSQSELTELFDQLFKNQKIYLEYNNYSNDPNEEESPNESSENNKNIKKELFLIIKLSITMKEEILLLPLEKRNDINEKYMNINFNSETDEEIEGNEKEVEDLSNNYNQLKLNYNNMVKNNELEIENLNKEIKELKQENFDLKEKINNLSEQANQLNDLINKKDNLKYSFSNIQNLIERIEILEELKEESTKSSKKNSNGTNNNKVNKAQIQEKINIKKLKKCFKSSSILTDETNFDFLLNNLNKYNPTSYKIIYKSSIDGDNIKNFHSNCDGEENVLIIIETNKGYKFGGFTAVGFDSSGCELRDDKAFLFSIDNQKIYEILPGNNAIYCNRKSGPIFCSKQDSIAYSIYRHSD